MAQQQDYSDQQYDQQDYNAAPAPPAQSGGSEQFQYDPNSTATTRQPAPIQDPQQYYGSYGSGKGRGNNNNNSENNSNRGNNNSSTGGYRGGNNGGGGYRGGNNGGGGFRGGRGAPRGGGFNNRGGGFNNRGGARGRGGFTAQKRAPSYNNDTNVTEGGADEGEFWKKRKINENVHRFLIPIRAVKVVIGVKGENIKALKAKAGEGCKCSIYTESTKKEPIIHGTSERVMSIEGNLEQVNMLLMDILPLIQAAPMDRFKGKLNLRLIIPEHCCSQVIGPKGANSKKIKEETGSTVQVFTDPLPNSGEHVVGLRNQDMDQLAKSAVKVLELIQETKSLNNVQWYEPHIWTPGEFGQTGSYHDDQVMKQQYNNNYYNQDQGYYQGGGGGDQNQGYYDESYQGGNQGGFQAGAQGDFQAGNQGGYQAGAQGGNQGGYYEEQGYEGGNAGWNDQQQGEYGAPTEQTYGAQQQQGAGGYGGQQQQGGYAQQQGGYVGQQGGYGAQQQGGYGAQQQGGYNPRGRGAPRGATRGAPRGRGRGGTPPVPQ